MFVSDLITMNDPLPTTPFQFIINYYNLPLSVTVTDEVNTFVSIGLVLESLQDQNKQNDILLSKNQVL